MLTNKCILANARRVTRYFGITHSDGAASLKIIIINPRQIWNHKTRLIDLFFEILQNSVWCMKNCVKCNDFIIHQWLWYFWKTKVYVDLLLLIKRHLWSEIRTLNQHYITDFRNGSLTVIQRFSVIIKII